jgi:dTDP-4-dehydrorhamnose 3,5-epimerase
LFDFQPLEIPDVILISPNRFSDSRGSFWETYSQEKFAAAGITSVFVQDNQSLSENPWTVRGLHAQASPFAQAKLVRVVRGDILDVAVDIRTKSPTFGKWVAARLSASNGRSLFIPRGFLHGFVTLERDTEVTYKVDAPYSKESELAVQWSDTTLGIDWGIERALVTVSEKDRVAPAFADFKSPF